jgi:serine-type D-Ala-D-Ala carboxypeptidase (penicillin-binding protein 5/6)
MNFAVAIILIVTFPFNSFWFFQKKVDVFALGNEKKEEVERPEGEVEGSEKIKEEKNLLPSPPPVPQFLPQRKEEAEDLAIPNAHSSLILDAGSGTILHYNNGKERRQIASLAKLMTAVLVMENVGDLEEEVTVDEEAVYIEGTKTGCPRSGYCIGERLKVGEKLTVLSLLKSMLLYSANDAAVALGKHISGTQEEFAHLMNKKTKELDLGDSNFCTPSGLEITGRESECYSSAYDIARIAAYSMKYNIIWEILRLPNATISSTDGKCTHEIINTDLVLDQVPNCLGGKTGFTPLAGRSLLLAANDETETHKIVAVLLDDPYRWQDIKTMIDWTFRAYDWR